jgi:hypothetical protein
VGGGAGAEGGHGGRVSESNGAPSCSQDDHDTSSERDRKGHCFHLKQLGGGMPRRGERGAPRPPPPTQFKPFDPLFLRLLTCKLESSENRLLFYNRRRRDGCAGRGREGGGGQLEGRGGEGGREGKREGGRERGRERESERGGRRWVTNRESERVQRLSARVQRLTELMNSRVVDKLQVLTRNGKKNGAREPTASQARSFS